MADWQTILIAISAITSLIALFRAVSSDRFSIREHEIYKTSVRDQLSTNLISNYEHALAVEARRRGCDGVICGHIHCASIRVEHGVIYANCGDWVESCTAIAEGDDGKLSIINWRTG